MDWMFAQPDEALFLVEAKPNFTYLPVRGSFNKAKRVKWGDKWQQTRGGPARGSSS